MGIEADAKISEKVENKEVFIYFILSYRQMYSFLLSL